jgi:hypothetical protein
MISAVPTAASSDSSSRAGGSGGEAEDADAALGAEAPALLAALSPLGRRVRQPASFLPLQSAEARGKQINATIGQITDGTGRALPLPAMSAALAGLDEQERSRALLYSPVEGLAELRRRWRERQRRGRPEAAPSSLPLVTAGMAQARALAADLFAAAGRPVLLPAPVRAADAELFAVRHQARMVEVAPGGWPAALAGLRGSEPALVLLDLALARNGPDTGVGEGAENGVATGAKAGAENAAEIAATGTKIWVQARTDIASETAPETGAEIAAALLAAAVERPLVAIAGGPPERPDGALFWELAGFAGRQSGLIPVLAEGVVLDLPTAAPADEARASGAGPVPSPRSRLLSGLGFLTFPYAPESATARILEEKTKMLLRAAVGSPPALLQTLLLAAL